MKRVSGIVLIIFGGIFLLLALGISIGAFIGAKGVDPVVVIVLFGLFVVGGLILWGGISLFRKGKPLGSGGGITGNLAGNTWISRTIGDFPYQYHFRPLKTGKHGHASLLTIVVNDDFPLPYVARPKKWLDRLGLRLGLSVPLTIADEGFNEQVYIETDYPEPVAGFFSSAAARHAVVDVLSRGFEKITKEPNQLKAEWTSYPVETRDNTADLEETAIRLSFLTVEAAKVENPEVLKMDKVSSFHAKFLKWTLTCLLAILGLWTIVGLAADSLRPPLPLRYFDLTSLSLQWLATVFTGYWILVFFFVKGRTTSHRDWLHCGGLGLLVFSLLIPWSLHLVNVKTDQSPDIVFQGKVVSKQSKKEKNKTSYWVVIPSRTDPQAWHEFSVTADMFRQVEAGTPFKLVTRKGALGVEWVVSLALAPLPFQFNQPMPGLPGNFAPWQPLAIRLKLP
ncbi:MAG: hypothetical protein EXR99_06430 [Gemmataceae bacterium]|nr:hypothetical protein [Gemmataceae bacterium]